MRSKEERQASRAARNAKVFAKRDERLAKIDERLAAKRDEVTKMEAVLDERIRTKEYEYWMSCSQKAEALVLEAAAEPNPRKSKDLAKRAASFAKSARKAHARLEGGEA